MKNYAYQEGCYPSRPIESPIGITALIDLHNSSYHTEAESNDYFIIHSKYFQLSQQYMYNSIHVTHNH